MPAEAAARVFEDKPGTRESTPLLVGIDGPSGSGKTYSALRMATGFQRVSGGDIYGIDTEARRMLHYADKFKFRHIEFTAPFGPLDYLAAIQHCVKKGAKTIVVDSMSHEHEGPGGVLEQHAEETRRLAALWNVKESAAQLSAWGKPKAERRRLINTMMQMNVNMIFCFRAKEKLKIVKGKDPVELGYMPIAGEEFIFEMMLCCLLLPGSKGQPIWTSPFPGEKAMMKLPEQFVGLFGEPKQLDEDIGMKLATWASGKASADHEFAGLAVIPPGMVKDYEQAEDRTRFDLLERYRATRWNSLNKADRAIVKAASDAARERLIKPVGEGEKPGTTSTEPPAWDIPRAIEALRATASKETCEKVFNDIDAYYERIGETVPVEIHGAYTDRLAAIEAQSQSDI